MTDSWLHTLERKRHRGGEIGKTWWLTGSGVGGDEGPRGLMPLFQEVEMGTSDPHVEW